MFKCLNISKFTPMSIFENYELAKYLLVPEKFYLLFNILLITLLFIVLLLKGLALWRSARLNQRIWFWIFIFVNTIGILEIVYLIAYRDGFREIKKKDKNIEGKKKRFSFKLRRGKKNPSSDEVAKDKGKTEEKKNEGLDLAELQNMDMNNWVS